MSKEIKKGVISFVGDEPMQLAADAPSEKPPLTTEQERAIGIVGKAVREYREAAKQLLSEKY